MKVGSVCTPMLVRGIPEDELYRQARRRQAQVNSRQLALHFLIADSSFAPRSNKRQLGDQAAAETRSFSI